MLRNIKVKSKGCGVFLVIAIAIKSLITVPEFDAAREHGSRYESPDAVYHTGTGQRIHPDPCNYPRIAHVLYGSRLLGLPDDSADIEFHHSRRRQLEVKVGPEVVPVVFNNPAENFLVKHLETGLTARNLTEYCKYIKLLYKNEPLRKELSANCKNYAKTHFSLASLAKEWDSVFSNILNKPKAPKIYKRTICKNYSFFDIFLESLGTHNEPFVLYLNNNNSRILAETLKQSEWQPESKGTLKHYNKFFDDKTIKKIMELYNE